MRPERVKSKQNKNIKVGGGVKIFFLLLSWHSLEGEGKKKAPLDSDVDGK